MYIVFNLNKIKKLELKEDISLFEATVHNFIDKGMKFSNRKTLIKELKLQKFKSRLNSYFANRSCKTLQLENYIIHRVKDSDIK